MLRSTVQRLLRGPTSVPRNINSSLVDCPQKFVPWKTTLALGGAGGAAGTAVWTYTSQATDEGLPMVYDHDAIRRYWSVRPVEVTQRAGHIAASFLPYGLSMLVDYKVGRLEEKEHMVVRAVELRDMLTALGPTFIKVSISITRGDALRCHRNKRGRAIFGQMLSIRPDIMPPAFIYELQKLCDAVPSFPTEQAIATIESELGRSVHELFEDLHLETLPIASASLGQVRSPSRDVAYSVCIPRLAYIPYARMNTRCAGHEESLIPYASMYTRCAGHEELLIPYARMYTWCVGHEESLMPYARMYTRCAGHEELLIPYTLYNLCTYVHSVRRS
eukprot:754580-Pyramimonas_sp.AAC.2